MTILASRAQLWASFARWALFLVPVVLLLGFFSGEISGSGEQNLWFASLEKPDIYPSASIFPIAWSILYVLMGIAAAVVATARGARGRGPALVLFFVQLALNLAWSPVFFAMHEIQGALILIAVLDIAVILTIIAFWRVRQLAGILLLPYIAWLAFATVLNWQLLELNPQADGGDEAGVVQRIEM